jgi:hypothetical protein
VAWTLEYNSTLRIVEIVLAGSITGPDLQESTSKAIALSKDQGIPAAFLVDATELELAASIVDLYDLPAQQYFAEGADLRNRLALVLPQSPKARRDARFYETACVNRGWNVKSFPNRDEAIEWLTCTESSAKRC